MFDPDVVPVTGLLGFVGLDASYVVRRAPHELPDKTTRLAPDFATRGRGSRLQSLRLGRLALHRVYGPHERAVNIRSDILFR